MENRSPNKRMDLKKENSSAATTNSVRIDVAGDGRVTIHASGDVEMRPAANDPAPQIGDVMEDGTIYAGTSPETGEALYVMPQDAPLKMTWKRASEFADELSTFAAYGCKDWRLPTRAEVEVLRDNMSKGALKDSFNGYAESQQMRLERKTIYGEAHYWSSTELSEKEFNRKRDWCLAPEDARQSADCVWTRNFDGFHERVSGKGEQWFVRLVRSTPAPR